MILLGLISVSGCHDPLSGGAFSRTFWNPFGVEPLFGLGVKPIRIGVVPETNTMLDVRTWWDVRERTPWTLLQRELARHTGRPVQIEQLQPFQVAAHLESGRLDFALFTTEQCHALMKKGKICHVIAQAKTTDRTGLIVASASSDIASMKEIAGRRFAFGPPGDPVLHYAASAALEAVGVSNEAIKREIVPLNSLQYHINSQEIAKEVVYGTTKAGVIERSEYQEYPQTGGRFLPLRFSKDQFRILGETTPVMLGPVVASNHADPELVESVRSFLISVDARRPQVAWSLGIAGFTGTEPSAKKVSAVSRQPSSIIWKWPSR